VVVKCGSLNMGMGVVMGVANVVVESTLASANPQRMYGIMIS